MKRPRISKEKTVYKTITRRSRVSVVVYEAERSARCYSNPRVRPFYSNVDYNRAFNQGLHRAKKIIAVTRTV